MKKEQKLSTIKSEEIKDYSKMEKLRGRTFFFSSDETHLKLETIKLAVLHSSIYKWSYVYHNRDKYTLADITRQREMIDRAKKFGKKYKGKILTENDIGKKKPNHYHIVLECSFSPQTIGTIAKWFELEPFMINIAKGNRGQNPFIDCCRYLTHEEVKQQQLGKQIYNYAEIEHSPNFDFETEMRKINEIKEIFGDSIDKKSAYFRLVSEGIKTLDDIFLLDEDFYNANIRTLEKLRSDYLAKRCPIPKSRINFYIEGSSGVGKDYLAKALARSLSPRIKDEYCFYGAMKGKFPFERYDGQEVVIWEDFRPYDLKTACGGKTGFFNIFDEPSNRLVGVKNSSTRLLNKYNIITGIMPFEEFFMKLASAFGNEENEEEDETKQVNQVKRRLPVIIKVNESDFSMLVNNGWIDTKNSFDGFTELIKVNGNMKKIIERTGGNEPLRLKFETKTVKPVIEEVKQIENKRWKKEHTKEEITEMEENLKEFGSSTKVNKPYKMKEVKLKSRYGNNNNNNGDDEDLPF